MHNPEHMLYSSDHYEASNFRRNSMSFLGVEVLEKLLGWSTKHVPDMRD